MALCGLNGKLECLIFVGAINAIRNAHTLNLNFIG